MSTFIVTGNYTTDAMKGMLARPSDRLTAVKPLVEAAGGKLISFYVTTGPNDFMLTVETDNQQGLMSALMVAGAAGGVSNLQTVQAFSAAEFKEAAKKAGDMSGVFKSANQ